jgi:hypothetical protein
VTRRATDPERLRQLAERMLRAIDDWRLTPQHRERAARSLRNIRVVQKAHRKKVDRGSSG